MRISFTNATKLKAMLTISVMALSSGLLGASDSCIAEPSNDISTLREKSMESHFIDRFTNDLGISEKQKADISAFFRKQLKDNGCLDKETKDEQMACLAAVRRASKDELRSFLTPEQQDKLDELVKSRQGNRLEQLSKKLNFTQRQKEEFVDLAKVVQQKCAGATTPEKREACVKQYRSEFSKNFDSLLTDEQKDKIKSLKARSESEK